MIQQLQRRGKKIQLSREIKSHLTMQEIVIYRSRHFNLSKRCRVNVIPAPSQQAATFELHA